MAAALPAKLKAAGLGPFATRAQQLDKFRPIVSYWTNYYILHQILSKDLHAGDAGSEAYAIQLMDKLEQAKAENPANDAITDDLAAKAYIENFAVETFNRADEAQRANKVTRQTADTFQAAATFMELLTIWGEVDVEFAAKGKFAKFHALRIARAIKAGEDPNASNPVVEEPRMSMQPVDDGVEQELRDLERQTSGTGDEGVYRAPTVEDAPDPTLHDDERGLPPLVPSSINDAPPPIGDHDVSPIDPVESSTGRQASIGGGYFPSVPDPPLADIDADMSEPGGDDIAHQQPPASMHAAARQQPAPPSPTDYYSTLQPPGLPTPGLAGTMPPPLPLGQTNIHSLATPPTIKPAPLIPPPSPSTHSVSVAPVGGYNTDDESVVAAQKHAKWAISALNFEDVGTAVKELRIALQALGAS